MSRRACAAILTYRLMIIMMVIVVVKITMVDVMMLSLSLLLFTIIIKIPLASDERISEFPKKNMNFIHNIYCR